MGLSSGQVRYGFDVTKEIHSKTFFAVKGFITRFVLLLQVEDQRLRLCPAPAELSVDCSNSLLPKGVEAAA